MSRAARACLKTLQAVEAARTVASWTTKGIRPAIVRELHEAGMVALNGRILSLTPAGRDF